MGALSVAACSGQVGESGAGWEAEPSGDTSGAPAGSGVDNPTGQEPGASAPGGGGAVGGGGGASTAGGGAGGDPTGAPGSTEAPGGSGEVMVGEGSDDPSAYLVPARIRRLSNLEYANSVRALLGTTELYEQALPADVRQRNFTANQAQTVSSDWNAAVEELAKAAASAAVSDGKLASLSPCTEATDACAGQFIDSFGARAFRRAVTPVERDGLLSVYRQGAAEGSFAQGAELVISTVLQAPSFIYITELGTASAQVIDLTGDEIASLLAYVVTQSPPDAALAEAGRSGALADPIARGEHARRLLATEAGKKALENHIIEWFTSDWVLNAAKDQIPEFAQYRDQLYAESRAFVRAVIDEHQSDFVTLLTADFTVASADVATYYGLQGNGKVSLAGTPRLGIMTEASFLGGHSSPFHSSPVKRGAAFMRQVLCTDPPDPSTVNLVVAAPEPDPTKSTRELFSAHSADATCQACHALIDPIGFAFEEFDEGGRVRLGPEDNNGKPIDASGTVDVGGTTFTWSNAREFLQQVAASDLSRRCVARTATRFGFGWTNTATELAFVDEWSALDVAKQTQIGEVLTRLIESDLFVQRRAQ